MIGLEIFQAVQQAVHEAKTELFIFILAVSMHRFVFGNYRVPKRVSKIDKLQGQDDSLKVAHQTPSGPGKKRAPAIEGARKDLVDSSTKQIAQIRNAAVKGSLDDAIAVFRACPKQCTLQYNAVVDACLVCGDILAAKNFTSEAIAAGSADITTYNTLVKIHLRSGSFQEAQSVIIDMRAARIEPNTTTFNELLDAAVSKNSTDVWRIVDEMEAAHVKPNQITCSIVLKSVQSAPHSKHYLDKALALLDKITECMDEVLLSSVIEACIRVDRIDRLRIFLRNQRNDTRFRITSSHAYGSLIRAYGATKDIDAVWEAWRELRARRIELTSVTIGCMVEAVVTNTGPANGYELIRELIMHAETRPLINSVIYGSVLKGFSHHRDFDKVWAVYKEMCQEGLQLSIMTYNTLVDACARCGEMSRVSFLLNDMVDNQIQPSIVTYSAIMKGYCQENRIDKALEVMDEMRRTSKFQPDEHIYNTIIGGCARKGMYDKGVALLEEMCQAGIAPSNFTLSVLVKLASRSRRLDKAFELVEELPRKFNFRLNVHVYNNLIQATLTHKDLRHAFQVIERMLCQRVRLDVRTYSLLLRACVDANDSETAAGLLRAGLGLKGAHLCMRRAPETLVQPYGGLPAELVTETVEVIAKSCQNSQVAVQLVQDLKELPGHKFDSKVMRRILSQ